MGERQGREKWEREREWEGEEGRDGRGKVERNGREREWEGEEGREGRGGRGEKR
jgi:hypothetical protein